MLIFNKNVTTKKFYGINYQVINMYLGNNIKILRKKYDISQSELALDNIDRTLLSKIENEKRPLTESLLNTIINNFNYILNKKEINITIDKEDFLSEFTQHEKRTLFALFSQIKPFFLYIKLVLVR